MKPEQIPASVKRIASFAHSIKRTKRRGFSCALTLAVMLGLAVCATPLVQSQTLTVLHAFTGGDGSLPFSGLIMDARGNLYGTTYAGGASGWGTVFKVNAQGKETVLHSFNLATDGAAPSGNLVRDSEGNLYGTTAIRTGSDPSYGTVFKVDNKGKATVLHSFNLATDGAVPRAGLVMDARGNLYGATTAGGEFGFGTVFMVNAKGKETVLYSFTGGSDGAVPAAALIIDAKGNLYGTTESGGGLSCNCGVVFKLAGKKEIVLYSFKGSLDGANPYAGLVMDAKGNLYGTTLYGGGNSCPGRDSYSCGAVFKVSKSGEEAVLYRFAFGPDGWGSFAGLTIDAKGSLYGTTANGGTGNGGYGYGTVFKVSPTGKETVLYRFTGGTDGGGPAAGLIMDTKGNFYGTAETGGTGCGDGGCGTVFKLTP